MFSTSPLDQIYADYWAFCAMVGIDKPMPAQRWLAVTDRLVKEATNHKPPASTVPKHCGPRNPAKDLRMACVKDAALNSIVPRLDTTSRGGFYNFKDCRACGRFLPKSRFSKQGESLRATCRSCDNSRLMLVRKNKQSTLTPQARAVQE